MAAGAPPNATAVATSRRSWRASRGRHSATSTSAAKPVRMSTVPVGPRSSKSDLATAAPACVDATPATTSSGAGGVRQRRRSADAVDLPEALALDQEQLRAVVERGRGLFAVPHDVGRGAWGLELLGDVARLHALLARAGAAEGSVLVAQRQPAAEHVELLVLGRAERRPHRKVGVALRLGVGGAGGRGRGRRGFAHGCGARLLLAAAAGD